MPWGHIRAMQSVGDRIKEARQLAGKTQADLARACEVSRAAVSLWEASTSTPTQDNLEKCALYLKVDFYWLMTGKSAPSISPTQSLAGETSVSGVPVVGTVEAGAWREVEPSEAEPSEYVPMPEDPRYKAFPRYAVRVNGDSVDLEIPDGGYAVYVDVADVGKEPADGQLVVAERIRHQGGLIETTIKQYRLNGRGAELWPCSSNPKHGSAISLRPSRRGDDIEVRVKGIVIGKYVPL